MAQLTVKNTAGKDVGKYDLPEDIFGQKVNQDVIHQATVMYRANLRQGNASTKERKEVRGGGKKPFKQKGTGRARAGSTRSPLWKGGGVTFGPKPRDFSYTIPKKIKLAALRESLKAKYLDDQLVCLDEIAIDSGKTKDFAKVLSALQIRGKVLALFDEAGQKVQLASRNIPGVSLTRAGDVNALDLMNNKNILLTKTSLETLLKRLQ